MLITTKFIGPTNTKPGRVKASFPSGLSVTANWDSNLGVDENHAMAMAELLVKLTKKHEYLKDGMPDHWVRRWDKGGKCVHVGVYVGKDGKVS